MNKQPANRAQKAIAPSGLSQPAQRALAGAGISQLKPLSSFREGEIKQLHGIGVIPIRQLRQALAERGLSLAQQASLKQ